LKTKTPPELSSLIGLMMASTKTTDEDVRAEVQERIKGMCHVVAVGGEDARVSGGARA
jgi:hypothetical protein